MDHQVLNGVQAVAILVQEGRIGVSECVECHWLADSGIGHPFLESDCGHA